MSVATTMTNGFFKELRDRHVLRVAGFYLLMSVPIMEAGDIVLPRLGLPDGSLTVVLWVLAIGFPVALILAWWFEITPDGVKSESELKRSSTPRLDSGRTTDFIIIGLLLAVVAWLGFDKLAAEATQTATTSGKPSIAVLPFVNMSSDKSNEYFSDGVSEELLNALAKIPQLRVAARTSSFFYKGRNEDLREIGRNLGVANVLEGSVRKDGDRVRVTAQLVSVDDGFHLWSETYDYTLDNVFDVQDQIARSVVEVLQIHLLGQVDVPVSRRPTSSTQAHTAYLRGRYELHRRTKESILRSTAFFSEATQADPQYAAAWVGLAESMILQFVNFQTLSRDDALEGAEAALQKAVALDDMLAEAYAALGLLRMQTNDNAEAEAAYKRAIEINPDYPEAWHWYGLLNGNMGDTQGALEKLRKSVDLDPLHRVARTNLGQAMMMSGDWKGAKAFFERGIELEPDYPVNYIVLADIENRRPWPRPRAALQLVNQALQYAPQDLDALGTKASLEMELQDLAAANATVATMRELYPDHQRTIGAQAGLLLYEADFDGALDFVNQSLALYGDKLGDTKSILVGIAAMIRGDYTSAADAWHAAYPDLFADEPNFHKKNVQFAGMVILTMQKAQRDEDAVMVLDALEKHLGEYDRFGAMGYALTDVEVAALRGQPRVALTRLQSALDAGYRNRLVHDVWTLTTYPVFESLWKDPQFLQIAAMIDGYHEQDRKPGAE